MRRVFAVGLSAPLVLLLLMAAPVAAAELAGGCSFEARSFDRDGRQIDQGSVPGPEGKGSQDNPFHIDARGSLDFLFRTGTTVFQNNRWQISVAGIPALSGSDDNPMDTDERGQLTIEQASPLPFEIVGLFFVSGDLYGNNEANHCHGEGWIYLVGDPVGSIAWTAALALLVLGAIALVATPYTVNWEVDPTSGERLRSGDIPMG